MAESLTGKGGEHAPLPATAVAFVDRVRAFRDERQQATLVDPLAARAQLAGLVRDVLGLLDRLQVQAISQPEDRAFFQESGDNHYAENLPLWGELGPTFAQAWDAMERPDVPSASRPPRAFSREEVQLQVAQYLTIMVRYWHELPAPNPLGGLAFSLLTLLDGRPGVASGLQHAVGRRGSGRHPARALPRSRTCPARRPGECVKRNGSTPCKTGPGEERSVEYRLVYRRSEAATVADVMNRAVIISRSVA